MDDRAKKLPTKIGLSPLRSLRDSLNRAGGEGREREMDVRVGSSCEVARFLRYVPPLPPGNFYFLATSPRSPRSLVSTMNDLFFHPFSPSSQYLASLFSVKFHSAESTSNTFLTGADVIFIFNDGYRWLLISEFIPL